MNGPGEKVRAGLDALSAEIALGAAHVHGRLSELTDRFGETRRSAEQAGWPGVAEQCERLGGRLRALVEDGRPWVDVERELRLSLELLGEMLGEMPPAALMETPAALAEAPPAAVPDTPAALPDTPSAGKSALEALGQDRELVNDFLMESREHLAAVEAQVLTLERNPGDQDAINAAFRGFHTIKGLAGFLGLREIRDLTHEVETALDLCRSGRLAMSRGVINVVLESADYLTAALETMERVLNGQAAEELPGHGDLVARVRAVAAGREEPEPELVPSASATAGVLPEAQPGAKPEARPEARPEAQPAAKPETKAETRAEAKPNRALAVKVDTLKLDHLVDMVGELVIAQSMVRHDPALSGPQAASLTRNLSQLERITGELQKTAMSMRLVRLDPLFQKMSRLVRDTSMKTGKRVEMVTAGEETELDRNIVEELADPLLHMIRNAVDHGIEEPAARRAAGKPEQARVGLRASYQAGFIQIEISDDGQGLNKERILRKALERGLVDAGAKLSDNEIFNLIFAPGFSTAETVTDLSGRGVGMDVVRKQIQKLRGRIDIESTPGQGTVFTLKLPLTLAIIDGLVVAVGSERFIIPIFAVKEMLRPTPDMLTVLEGKVEMAMIRGRVLPVIKLHECFGLEPRYTNPAEALLIVSECDGKPFALMVDELTGKQEVVLKSLGVLMRHNLRGLTGCAILGDGRVGLILDMEALFRG